MDDILMLGLALGAGGVLGVMFFGGLWWTVRKGIASRRPALWFLGSLLLRVGLVLLGFHFAFGGHWQRMLACLVGFVIARFIVVRLTGAPVEHGNASAQKASHAT